MNAGVKQFEFLWGLNGGSAWAKRITSTKNIKNGQTNLNYIQVGFHSVGADGLPDQATNTEGYVISRESLAIIHQAILKWLTYEESDFNPLHHFDCQLLMQSAIKKGKSFWIGWIEALWSVMHSESMQAIMHHMVHSGRASKSQPEPVC